MKSKTLPVPENLRQGFALVLVLAFVALLVGVALAFLSNALLQRQVSSSSANITKGDLFAQGATDQIIGDLRQEIVAGSVVTTVGGGGGTSIYTPKSPATVVPSRVGFSPSFASGIENDGLTNLVKRSVSGQAFYPGTNYDGNGARRALNASSIAASLNGRNVSPARWNKPLFLQKASPTDDENLLPIGATATAWSNAPDWVAVARNSTNPISWNATMTKSGGNANPNEVIGRYAYMIYDEGGLLDANVAGYPAVDYPSAAPAGVTLPFQPSRKSALAYADLTVAVPANSTSPSGSTQPLMTPAQVNALVGWRNYASSQPEGSFPSYTAKATPLPSPSLYDTYVLSNSTGFLNAGSPALFGNRTDRFFSGRQQLIEFLTQAVATDSSSRAALQHSLQYLTTFSRDLNQPSYSPNPGRPTIVPLAAGGNDHVGRDTGVLPSNVNPAFLQARMQSSFRRNDGTTAVSGDVLVKRRFALSRLSWLTYQGRSADRNLSPSSTQFSWGSSGSPMGVDYDVFLLQKSHGITPELMAQGNGANIYRYFGLSWVPDTRPIAGGGSKWFYSHQQPNPGLSATASPVTSISGSGVPIMSLSQVAAAGREPDFVELLKAAICAGSLGKAATSQGTAVTPGGYQNSLDVSLDAQVIQIAANIIDQFDVDGFPTSIVFNDGTWTQECRGVEDLPYLYHVRAGQMKVHDSNPSTISGRGGYRDGRPWRESDQALVDAGIGAFFQVPAVWNPHGWLSTNAYSGAPRPVSFRMYAVAQPPLSSIGSPDPNQITLQAGNRYNTAPPGYLAPGYQSAPLTAQPQTPLSLSSTNTELDFDIPLNRLDLFREPTLLNKPNVPAGTNLRSGVANAIKSYPMLSTYVANGELKSDSWIPAAAAYANNNVTDDGQYLGIFLGAFPLRFVNTWTDGNRYVYTARAPDLKPSALPLTYRLQFQDPTRGWITYDEKYCDVVTGGIGNGGTGDSPSFDNNMMATGDGSTRVFIDPRTSRFGSFQTIGGNPGGYPILTRWGPGLGGTPPYTKAFQAGWAAPTQGYNATPNQNAAQQNALWTARPDEYSGSGFSPPFGNVANAAVAGWYLTGGANLRVGVIAQNNMAASNGPYRYRNGPLNGGEPGASGPQYFSDPDGVVRRGMAAYTKPTGSDSADPNFPTTHPSASSGIPSILAMDFTTLANGTPIVHQMNNRPIVLNRPFRSVGELSYVFGGTPWRNLDFATPESGGVALMDVFCVNDTMDATALVAGKVNLNTRQVPVIEALLAGAYKDELDPRSVLTTAGSLTSNTIATALVRRTGDLTGALGAGSGPLTNVADMIGKYVATTGARPFDGGIVYKGFSGTNTTSAAPPANPPTLSSLLAADLSPAGYTTMNVERFREAVIRALSSAGTTRVWNLMIDVVAQTGGYPASATGPNDFLVEGETRYWVHLAIDRFTGNVIDRQIEVVKE